MTDPGAHDSITDVEGIAVGHWQRIDSDATVATPETPGAGWATGTTVLTLPAGAVAAVDCRGGAPGTRETDLLDPVNTVQTAHAIVLSGGSAFGLAAADGVMSTLERRGVGIAMDAAGNVVPIVPAAVIFDLPVGGWTHRPDAEFGRTALGELATSEVAQGSVGAGAGARAGALKGGVGSASLLLAAGPAAGITVGALMVANPVGSMLDPETGLPWETTADELDYFGLQAPDDADRAALAELTAKSTVLNTIVGVVATDAQLDKAATRRVAIAAHDGLARAVRPAHTPMDGDTIFAVSTGQKAAPDPVAALPPGLRTDAAALAAIGHAAAVVTRRAVVNAVIAATTVAGIPALRDVLPSAVVRRD